MCGSPPSPFNKPLNFFKPKAFWRHLPPFASTPPDAHGAVKAFYRAWQRRPYFHRGHLGSGLYAVSAEGRARFDRFPNLIADDEFFRLHFHETERSNASNAFFEIRAPRRIWGVIKVKTRSRLGRLELKKTFPPTHLAQCPSQMLPLSRHPRPAPHDGVLTRPTGFCRHSTRHHMAGPPTSRSRHPRVGT